MAKGESEMSWYAEVILSYYRETIRYGKAARQSTYRKKPFFSSKLSVVFITESHEELWAKSDGYGRRKRNIRLLRQKNVCGWYDANKVH